MIGGRFGNFTTFKKQTLVINEYEGSARNEIFEAAELYLPTIISPSADEIIITKTPRDKTLAFSLYNGQRITEEFQGIQLTWEIIRAPPPVHRRPDAPDDEEYSRNSLKLIFQKKHGEKVLNTYLPYVLDRGKALKEQKKVIKLQDGSGYREINFDHPSTFDTLAMDPTVKKELIHDLDRFVRRRDFYRRVGKPWKQEYLLYGPAGTGKSSLIAAMANYLKFDVYDLELKNLTFNSQLRGQLASTKNRSIIVIQDVDCAVVLEDRRDQWHRPYPESRLSLSGLIFNIINGLWASTGDERVFVFTTNDKENISSDFLSPGQIDMHIHMSYLMPFGLKVLASNYLGIKDHFLFTEIEGLLTEVEVTPSEVAEELMKNEGENVNILVGLIEFLKRKKEEKITCDKSNDEEKQREKITDENDSDDEEQNFENVLW